MCKLLNMRWTFGGYLSDTDRVNETKRNNNNNNNKALQFYTISMEVWGLPGCTVAGFTFIDSTTCLGKSLWLDAVTANLQQSQRPAQHTAREAFYAAREDFRKQYFSNCSNSTLFSNSYLEDTLRASTSYMTPEYDSLLPRRGNIWWGVQGD
jgi:hypothetical protein